MYDITFNDQRASHTGLLVVRRPDIPVPVKKVDLITVAGRDGALISDISRYEPITISVALNFMASPDNWNERLRAVRKWANGSGRLTMSDDELYYYRVYYTEVSVTERTSKRIGVLTVDFICDPYQYRIDGQEAYEVADVKYNPYDVCHPAYIITGSGTAALTVNGKSVLAVVNDKITIDSELMIAYDSFGNAANTSTIGDFEALYLREGENEIDITDGFELKIRPRWRHI